MNATAIDSRIFRNLFGTEEARQIFLDEQYVSRMIDVETALARAQATADVIPQSAADSITESCNVTKIKYVLIHLLSSSVITDHVKFRKTRHRYRHRRIPSTPASRATNDDGPYRACEVHPLGSHHTGHTRQCHNAANEAGHHSNSTSNGRVDQSAGAAVPQTSRHVSEEEKRLSPNSHRY